MDATVVEWRSALVSSGCDSMRATRLAMAICEAVRDGASLPRRQVNRPLVDGECYALLFAQAHREEVLRLGLRPDVASLRRFANSVKHPHDGVLASACAKLVDGAVLWHVTPGDMPAVDLLAAMDKKALVGATVAHPGDEVGLPGGGIGLPSDKPKVALVADKLKLWPGKLRDVPFSVSGDTFRKRYPDSVSDAFPDAWIPAIRHSLVTYNHDHLILRDDGLLDIDAWQISHDGVDKYAEMLHPDTRIQWHFWLHPLSPRSDEFTVFEDGEAKVCREWHSVVAPWDHFLHYSVRGLRVMARVDFWRPSRLLLSVPRTISPILPGGSHDGRPDHEDLFGAPLGAQIFDNFGLCYSRLFHSELRCVAVAALGVEPRVSAVVEFARAYSAPYTSCGVDVEITTDGKYHIVAGNLDPANVLIGLDQALVVGSTQEPLKTDHAIGMVGQRSILEPAVRSTMTFQVPLAAIVKHSDANTTFSWEFRKLGYSPLCAFFESVRMVSASLTFTVVGGDNDSVCVAALTSETSAPDDTVDWYASPYSVILSGNVNGSTSAQLVLPDRHTFGTELRALNTGNFPPVLHCDFSTKVPGQVIVRGLLVVEVSGAAGGKFMNMNKGSKPRGPKSRALELDAESSADESAIKKGGSPPRVANASVRRA